VSAIPQGSIRRRIALSNRSEVLELIRLEAERPRAK
jgi:hypothetical protein